MKYLKVLLVYFTFNCLVHLPFLNIPPSGSHVWRQCNTLGMTRNFAEESMNIFAPRIDRRNETNGITGSHFPLFEWQLAGVYKITGEHYIVARLYSALIFSIAMMGIYTLLMQLGVGLKLAFAGGLGLLSIPQLYYDSINAMPDIYALGLALLSAVFFIKDSKDRRVKYWILAVVMAILGGLIKFQFLVIPFAFFSFYRIDRSNIIRLISSLLMIIIPVVLWYRHAIALTQLNNLREFGLWIKPISGAEKWQTVKGNLMSDLPELLIGYPLLLGITTVVIYRKFKFKKSALFYTIFLWILGFGVFYILAIERMQHHSYYFMAILPMVIVVFIKGISEIKNSWRYAYWVLALNMVWAGVRIVPSRWVEGKRQIPAEFMDVSKLNAIRSSIPKGSKCLVGPDKSGCIYFYFTDTEGYSFEDPQELLSEKAEGAFMDILYKAGVRYVICDQAEEMDKVMRQLPEWREYRAIGAFKIWTHR